MRPRLRRLLERLGIAFPRLNEAGLRAWMEDLG